MEVAFFESLRSELAKVKTHYEEAERAFAAQYEILMRQFEEVQASGARGGFDVDPVALVTRLVRFYMDLILLENYAVMCYCAFGKILKKHDKVTGHRTRQRYMMAMVNPMPFTHYPLLLKMMHYTEAAYLALLQFMPEAQRHLMPHDAARLAALHSIKAESHGTKVDVEASTVGGDSSAPPAAAAPSPSTGRNVFGEHAGPGGRLAGPGAFGGGGAAADGHATTGGESDGGGYHGGEDGGGGAGGAGGAYFGHEHVEGGGPHGPAPPLPQASFGAGGTPVGHMSGRTAIAVRGDRAIDGADDDMGE